MENFVKAQKQFLDVIAEETAKATSGKHSNGTGKKVKKAEFSEVFWPVALSDVGLRSVRTGPLRQMRWLDDDGFDALVTNAKKGMANAAIPLFRCVSLCPGREEIV